MTHYNLSKRKRDELYPLIVRSQGGEFCYICKRKPQQLRNNGKTFKLCVNTNGQPHISACVARMRLVCNSCRVEGRNLINHKEEGFRRWVDEKTVQLYSEIIFEEQLSEKSLINAGAERFGCSPITIKRYLDKMTSSEGGYEWDYSGRTRRLKKKIQRVELCEYHM